MFEIGWTEMLVIAVVMIVVVGPKDLPKMLRAFGKTTAKVRSMAGDFQKQFNEALKEAELDDVKKSVDSLRSLNPATEIKKQLNPFEKAASDVRAGLDTLKPKPPEAKPAAQAAVDGASPVAVAAEPLKNGAISEAPSSAMPAAAPMAVAASVPDPAAPAAVSQPATKAAKPRAPRAPRKPADPSAPAKPRKKKTESSAP